MAEREQIIDFTAPYYEMVGLTILIKKAKVPTSIIIIIIIIIITKVPTSIWRFLGVLEDEVWLCILGSYLGTSLLLWIFDRYKT